MNVDLLGAVASLGLGALTVIHPCPLSTNAAAVSLLYAWNQRYKSKTTIILPFVFGEVIALVFLGMLISKGMIQIPVIANFLQSYVRQFLGPVLIIVGMMLSGILLSRQKVLNIADRIMRTYSRTDVIGGFTLGIVAALSFCPMSAAMFFGVLIPLAVSAQSVVLYPALFGVGSSIPLLIIALLIGGGAMHLENLSFVKKLRASGFRVFVGIAMILLGVFMSLRYVFEVV